VPQILSGCFGEEKNILHRSGSEPWIVRPVAYTLYRLHYPGFLQYFYISQRLFPDVTVIHTLSKGKVSAIDSIII
jgi:hypothetical protein